MRPDDWGPTDDPADERDVWGRPGAIDPGPIDPGAIDPATGEVLELEDDPAVSLADRVFSATPTLERIRQAAHARLVVPWAVLGAVLVRVVAEIPPHVVLPPIVGTDASLNLAVALVADSGGGKSGAVGCAGDVVRIGQRFAQDIGPGSGEGIMHAFLERDPETKSNVIRTHPLALLAADEVAHIGAVQGRTSGATFAPIVRTMLTGGPVATSAVDPERRRQLPAHTYRLCVVSGVQPRLADVLLNDTDAGTPQRWLWLPADDPTWNVGPTDWPGRIAWTFPTLPRHDPDGRIRLAIPDEARAAIIEARNRRIRGEGDPLDGHRLLTREKVAAALALLHGDTAITSDWWKLAGLVMHRSDVTRARCADALAVKAEAEHRARGRLDAARESGAREARTDESTKHARIIWRTVTSKTKHSGAAHEPLAGCTRRCFSTALRNHRGADRDAAIRCAEDLAWIVQRNDTGDETPRYFPGEAMPADEAP